MKQITETGKFPKELKDISSRHLNDLEQLITQTLKVMRAARLEHYPLYTSLRVLERDLGELRRERYDANNSPYTGY